MMWFEDKAMEDPGFIAEVMRLGLLLDKSVKSAAFLTILTREESGFKTRTEG
jgi:hypothetical protein